MFLFLDKPEKKKKKKKHSTANVLSKSIATAANTFVACCREVDTRNSCSRPTTRGDACSWLRMRPTSVASMLESWDLRYKRTLRLKTTAATCASIVWMAIISVNARQTERNVVRDRQIER